MKWAIALLAVFVVAEGKTLKYEPKTARGQVNWTPPGFCNKLDCPQYQLVSKQQDYEVRKYIKSSWISTNMEGADYNEASRALFGRLFNYIGGNNKQKKKIAMTAPVITRIIPGQGPACANNFTMSFFVSTREGSDIPEPTDSKISVTSLKEETVYVRSFSGFTFTIETWLKEAAALTKAVPEGSYVADHYFIAGYDSPFKLMNRHNEIWFIKK